MVSTFLEWEWRATVSYPLPGLAEDRQDRLAALVRQLEPQVLDTRPLQRGQVGLDRHGVRHARVGGVQQVGHAQPGQVGEVCHAVGVAHVQPVCNLEIRENEI